MKSLLGAIALAAVLIQASCGASTLNREVSDGRGIDPNGDKGVSVGPRMDDNGRSASNGSHMDPNGRTVSAGTCIDPNGGDNADGGPGMDPTE